MAETAVAPTKCDAARRRPSGIRRTNARRFLIAVGVATGAVGLVGCGDSRTEAPRTIAVSREPAQATPRAGPKRRAAKRATPTIRSCDPNIRVRATTTSCPFAENVFYSYWLNEQDPGVFADSPGLPAYSPARGRMFYVDCTGIDMVTCRDGGVYVTFPASAVSRYTTAAALRYAATAELGEVPTLIERAQGQLKELQREVATLHEQLLPYVAAALMQAAENIGPLRLVVQHYPDKEVNALKALASQLTQQPGMVALLATTTSGKLSLIFARAQDAEPQALHMGNLLRDALAPIGGKGGGKPDFAQGGSGDAGAAEQVLAFARQQVTTTA